MGSISWAQPSPTCIRNSTPASGRDSYNTQRSWSVLRQVPLGTGQRRVRLARDHAPAGASLTLHGCTITDPGGTHDSLSTVTIS
jgi:hypothetical protein